jgi:hypothetical protein
LILGVRPHACYGQGKTMALGKCRECGKEASSEAKACPHCGATNPVKKTSVFTIVAGLLFIAFVGIAVSNSVNRQTSPASPQAIAPVPNSVQSTTVPSAPVNINSPAIPPEPASSWHYDTETDRMTGKEARYAIITSENQLQFGFPYSGPNQPSLTLRKHPKYGTDVILRIEKGQFICGVSSCTVHIRFDDRPPVRFTANGPSDHSSTVLFLEPALKIISALKNAKATHVQATFYKEGDQVMSFNTAGLEWK